MQNLVSTIHTPGVRNIGSSSNEYLVWLVHLPAASEQVGIYLLMSCIFCSVYKAVGTCMRIFCSVYRRVRVWRYFLWKFCSVYKRVRVWKYFVQCTRGYEYEDILFLILCSVCEGVRVWRVATFPESHESGPAQPRGKGRGKRGTAAKHTSPISNLKLDF